MLNPTFKIIKDHIELLKDIKWLKENINKMSYPTEIDMDDLDKLETQIIKKILNDLKKTNF